MKKKQYFYLILVLFCLIIGSLAVLKAQESRELLHFVQISDTHLQRSYANDGVRLLGSSEKLLKDAIKQINNIQDLDFVLFTGDQVDVPEEDIVDKFLEITQSLKYPSYFVLGNHDVGVNSDIDKKEYIKKFTKDKNSKSFTDQMSYYSFSPNDKFTIICLDGTTEEIVTSHGQIDEKQLEWLKKELETNKDKYVIIAIHYPVIQPFKSETHYILEPDRTKLEELITSYSNVISVFSGHYHTAKLTKIKNQIHNSCPAVIQYPNAFREIIVRQGDSKYLSLEFKWHAVNGEDLRNISKNGSSSWKLTQGTPEDQETLMKVRLY